MEFAIVKVKNVVDQVEIHILVHVSVFEAFTSHTGGIEEVRLNINAVSSELVVGLAQFPIFLIASQLLR